MAVGIGHAIAFPSCTSCQPPYEIRAEDSPQRTIRAANRLAVLPGYLYVCLLFSLVHSICASRPFGFHTHICFLCVNKYVILHELALMIVCLSERV